ncbi:hypothetical protein HELRODRAFT_176396 [Helobdella robusta]|uniref:Nucleoprotein TPR/MPL1 domain-containing protein n=1 Tax=Helobdella robusta TaxID=6412 RepID=T1FAH1_HELRO|nr:hypothetical protein HELRODRAFT_176396 [Helobdella robusta]ESO00086.1 hypothetical protein HELRODRAFT_176396 [Helobdella robusta]
MDYRKLLPKSFTELFDVEIENIFTESQLNDLANLSSGLKEPLQKFISDLQAKHAKLKTDSIRQIDMIETRSEITESKLELIKNELEDKDKALTSAKEQCTSLSNKNKELSDSVKALEISLYEKEKSWNAKEHQLLSANSKLELERDKFSDMLTQRNNEIDRLTDEWRQLTDKLKEANSLRIMAQTLAEDSKSELVIIQNREVRLKSELAQTTHQVEVLSKELQAKFDEITSTRKEKSVQLLQLQATLDETIEKLNQAEQLLEISKKAQSEQCEQIEHYIKKLNEAKDNQINMEERYRLEVISQEKLVNLYKSYKDDAEKKLPELAKIAEDSQNLEEELSTANQLLESFHKRQSLMELTDEDIEEMSPVAAAACKMLRSNTSLTQNIEESAPTLRVQKRDYLRCLERNEQLTLLLKEATEARSLYWLFFVYLLFFFYS